MIIENNIEFPGKGRIVPATTNIFINMIAMGRNPNVFKNPFQFNPQRFAAHNLDDFSNNFAYVPFSAGPRNCIGQRFAMYEMKSIITKILRHYEISLVEDKEPVLRAGIVLRPGEPIKFTMKPRIYL